MPLIEMKEVVTPLKLIGIKFFRSREGQLYIKLFNRPRRKIFSVILRILLTRFCLTCFYRSLND